jgi:hypothetical protein
MDMKNNDVGVGLSEQSGYDMVIIQMNTNLEIEWAVVFDYDGSAQTYNAIEIHNENLYFSFFSIGHGYFFGKVDIKNITIQNATIKQLDFPILVPDTMDIIYTKLIAINNTIFCRHQPIKGLFYFILFSIDTLNTLHSYKFTFKTDIISDLHLLNSTYFYIVTMTGLNGKILNKIHKVDLTTK